MSSMLTRRIRAAAAAVVALTLCVPLSATADNLVGYGDGLVAVGSPSVSFGNIAYGATSTKSNLGFTLQRDTSTLSYVRSQDVTLSAGVVSDPAVSTAVTDASMKTNTNWTSGNANNTLATDGGEASITVSAVGADCGPKTATIGYTATGIGVPTIVRTTQVSVSWTVINCPVATTLTVASAPIVYGATSGSVSATLTRSGGITVSGKPVAFALTEASGTVTNLGSATTGTGGVAALPITIGSRTAGTYNLTATFAGDTSTPALNASNGSGNLTIAKADAAINVAGYSGPYDGGAHSATGSATGVKGENLNGSLNLGASFTDAPGGTATWAFAGDANHKPAQGTVNIAIAKRNAVVSVAGYTGMYDGAPHGATGSATGLNNAILTDRLDLGATFVEVPGGTANWTFNGGTNYNNDSGSVGIAIGQANAIIDVAGYSGIFDGAAHGATGSAAGINGESLDDLLRLGAEHTNAGTHTVSWTFDGNANYSAASGSVTVAIAKASATISVDGYTGTYDAQSHGASGSATGVLGEQLDGLRLGESHTNAGTHTVDWTFDGNGNYEPTGGSVEVVIERAPAVVAVSGFDGVYDGFAHEAIGTAEGVDGSDLTDLLIVEGSFTDGGTHEATWTFAGDGNHLPSNGVASVNISKASASTIINAYSGTFDAAEHGATGSATGVQAESLSHLLTFGNRYTDVPGGIAAWSFAGNQNYLASDGDVNVDIAPATALIVVDGFSGSYDGGAHGATGTATGVADVDLDEWLSFSGSYTDVPGGVATWTFAGHGNYVDANGSVDIAVDKADATIDVPGVTVTYDGAQHFATGSATGVGNSDLTGQLDVGLGFTNYPGGTAIWSFDGGPNYSSADGSVIITIVRADATVDVNGGRVTYDGNAHRATGTASGVTGEDLTGLLSLGADFTDAPGGTANWTFNAGNANNNYNTNGGSVDITIDKADADVQVSGYTGNYDADPHGATGTATGVGAFDLSSQLDLGASYTDAPGGVAEWSFAGGTNYNDDGGQVDVTIGKIDAAVTVDGYVGDYDGNAHGATGSATGLNSSDLSGYFDLGQTFTNVPGGTADWSFSGDVNYHADNGSVTIAIGPGLASLSVDGYDGVYDGAAHGITGTAVGVNGEDLSGDFDFGPTYTDAGTYDVQWSFDAGDNYERVSGTATITIAKADATVEVIGYSGPYDGDPHGAAGTATGVGGIALSSQLDLGASFTNVTGGVANWSFSGGQNYNDKTGTVDVDIAKANATINVTGYTGTYDGDPHGATGTATGAKGESLAVLLNLGASFAAAPGGTATWTFLGGQNYNDKTGTVDVDIAKANATINVTGYTGTYDGDPHGATGAATGAKGEDLAELLHLGPGFTNVPGGAADWRFDGNDNYNSAGGTATITITKANATINVNGYNGVYDGSAHYATGTATGRKGEALSSLLSLGSGFTDVPGGVAGWAFSGNGNYNSAGGNADIVITKATQTISFGALPNATFGDPAFTVAATGGSSGQAVTFGAAGNCTLVGSTVTLTSKGSCTITASQAGTGNYSAATSVQQSLAIAGWTINGFYSPVDMPQQNTIVWNTVKGGSTVPLKFNIMGTVERTNTTDVSGFTAAKITCTAAPEDGVAESFLTTGGTSLRYSGTPGDGQFIQNWQTPKTAGICYRVTMTARDGSSIMTYFKTK